MYCKTTVAAKVSFKCIVLETRILQKKYILNQKRYYHFSSKISLKARKFGSDTSFFPNYYSTNIYNIGKVWKVFIIFHSKIPWNFEIISNLKIVHELKKLIYHYVVYNNFLHKNTIKNCKLVYTRKLFAQLLFSKYLLYSKSMCLIQ